MTTIPCLPLVHRAVGHLELGRHQRMGPPWASQSRPLQFTEFSAQRLSFSGLVAHGGLNLSHALCSVLGVLPGLGFLWQRRSCMPRSAVEC